MDAKDLSPAGKGPYRGNHFRKMHPRYVRGAAASDKWWSAGFCSRFACAFQQRFGIPVSVLIEEAVEDGHKTLLRAVCYRDGVAWDADGARSLTHLLSGYGFDPKDASWWSTDMMYPGERTRLRFEQLSVGDLERILADFDAHVDALAPAFAYIDAHAERFPSLLAPAATPEAAARAAEIIARYLPVVAEDTTEIIQGFHFGQ